MGQGGLSCLAGDNADAALPAAVHDAGPLLGIRRRADRLLPRGQRGVRRLRERGQPGRAAVGAAAGVAHQPGQLHGGCPPGGLLPGALPACTL